jgi:hypothetical protein
MDGEGQALAIADQKVTGDNQICVMWISITGI